jgi:hypothetical protein
MLIFDFDGVLVNSIDEITVTAYNVTTDKLVMRLGDIPGTVPSRFQKNRFHVQSIGDVVPLMHWCIQNDHLDPDFILTREEYLSIRQQETAPLIDRVNGFFSTRKRFVEMDEERWLALNGPFQPIWDALKKYPSETVILLTNKNRAAAIHLCRYFGLILKEENVYSGDDGITKIENLNRIHQRLDHAPYDFIDDSLMNLRELDLHFNRKEPFLRLILAAWGYTGPGDEDTARSLGYAIFSQNDLIDLMCRRLSS